MDYFVIPTRSNPPIKIVIRDLPQGTSADTIKGALATEGKFKVDKVVQLTRFKTKQSLPLFQVTLPNIEENKDIWTLRSLLYLRIKIEKSERKTGSLQCFKCCFWLS
ncbi:hypothetical protein AVEN_159852-1 [Araneus ventricosus]|uniref:Pre-C2HC domain-containing protein n=1 Tax=Araneus ventricosus TaxID=182803 RepID=A0A4Y2HFP1_ARAVE|nr:hypothetical protein AVEN_159852-1 [Araneus ventricosus]